MASSSIRVGVNVNMYSYVFTNAPDNNYLILRYDIQNVSGANITNLYAGQFFDWDIQDYSTNKSGYDTARSMGYAWDAGAPSSVYCGTRVLEGTPGFRALINNNLDVSDAAKFSWLSGGIVTNMTTGDIHYTVSSGPFSIPNGSSIRIAFALIGGTTLADLQNSSDASLAKWDEIKTRVSVDDKKQILPTKYSLSQNYPNPFNPTTKIQYSLTKPADVSLRIYDILGRELATLVNERKPAGTYTAHWNAESVPNGVYFYRIVTDGFVETKKMILMK